MRFSGLANALTFFGLFCASAVGQSFDPPTLTPLFTIRNTLAPGLPPVPIAQGGLQLIEPLTGGSIAGPAFNGTFGPGLAYPTVDTGNTVQFPQIVLYGTSTDNTTDFLAIVTGVGSPNDQWVRVQLTIGGAYSYLQNQFIVGHIQADRTNGQVVAPCWCLDCTIPA